MKRFLLLGGLHLAAQAALASEIVDVKAHGASGDGTTLDTTAIQSALDACAGAG
jgi:polygalacturonase